MSIVELVISIGVLSTMILLVLGIYSGLINGSQKSVDLTAGSVVAEGLLSQQIYQITSNDTTRNAIYGTPCAAPTVYKSGTYSLNNIIYAYKIYSQDVSLGTPFHSQATDGTTAGGATTLKRLDIVVWWNDGKINKANAGSVDLKTSTAGSGAHGQGLQQVHQARLLWPGGPY